MKFNLLSCFLLAVWTMSVAAGCAAPGIPTRAANAGLMAAAPAGPVGEALKAAAKVYEETSGQAVQVEILAADLYYDRLRAFLLAGRDDYDLMYLPADLLPHWAAYHALRPLEIDPAEQAALAPWLEALSWEGVLYGLPAQADMDVLWYRADLFQQAGLQPPRDWQQWKDTALALDQPPERRGMVFAAGIGEAGVDFAPYLAGFCAPAAGWQDCAPDRQRQALAFYSQQALAGGAAPEGIDFSRADAAGTLRAGQAAMAILPLAHGPALLACAPDSRTCHDGRSLLHWAAVPGLGEARVTGSLGAWVVPVKAARPEAGARFAAWLSGKAGARAWALAGGLPAHPGPAHDPAVLAEFPYLAVLAQVGRYLPPLPATTGAEGIWNAYHGAVHTYVAQQVHEPSPAGLDAALEAVAGQVALAFRRDGRLE
jgi:multiple sugar transport system substrate-binding protein